MHRIAGSKDGTAYRNALLCNTTLHSTANNAQGLLQQGLMKPQKCTMLTEPQEQGSHSEVCPVWMSAFQQQACCLVPESHRRLCHSLRPAPLQQRSSAQCQQCLCLCCQPSLQCICGKTTLALGWRALQGLSSPGGTLCCTCHIAACELHPLHCCRPHRLYLLSGLILLTWLQSLQVTNAVLFNTVVNQCLLQPSLHQDL